MSREPVRESRGVRVLGVSCLCCLERDVSWTHVVNDGCPWPERRGLRCRVVTGSRGYPFSMKAKGEVVVLIENDPHSGGRSWSCVLDRSDLTVIDSQPALFGDAS